MNRRESLARLRRANIGRKLIFCPNFEEKSERVAIFVEYDGKILVFFFDGHPGHRRRAEFLVQHYTCS